MRIAGRLCTMKKRSIGRHSPPRSIKESKYGGLKRFGINNIKRLNGGNVFLLSLGSIGIKKPSSWRNPPNAPNRQGTLQENIEFWKGQKRFISFLQELIQKINWRSFKNMEFNYESSTSDPHRKKFKPERIG